MSEIANRIIKGLTPTFLLKGKSKHKISLDHKKELDRFNVIDNVKKIDYHIKGDYKIFYKTILDRGQTFYLLGYNTEEFNYKPNFECLLELILFIPTKSIKHPSGFYHNLVFYDLGDHDKILKRDGNVKFHSDRIENPVGMDPDGKEGRKYFTQNYFTLQDIKDSD